jgi:4-amino-4-deoxy-L-arabinose transferase-like glycosyltransferase
MKPRQAERVFLLLILLSAAFFRLWKLDSVPPGLTHDEANNVHDAVGVLDGVRPFYFPVAQGKEPLYPYSVAALMALLGRSPWVMRLTSGLFGLLMVLMAYAWARRAFDPVTALLTAAGLAVGFWPVSVARMGLRAITLPALFTTAAYLTWRGMGVTGTDREPPARRRIASFLLAGGALGLCLYTYLAARLMPAVPLLLCLYLALLRPDWWRRVRGGLLMGLVVAAIMALPLFLYLRAHPAAEIRIGQLDRPLRALLDGDPSLLLDRAGEAAGMLSFDGDSFIPYNLPGKPLLDPVMSVLFYSGLLLAFVRWRRPAYAYALFWLAMGLAPALATGIEAANLRAVAAQPAVMLFPALALAEVGRFVTSFWGSSPGPRRRAGLLLALGAVILFSIIAGQAFRDYFVRWANDRDVRVHYHVDLVAVAETLRVHAGETVAVSALYPGQYHDPRVVEAVTVTGHETIRWFDGRTSLVLPGSRPATFVFPSTVPLNPALQPLAGLEYVSRVELRPDDLTPRLDLYRGYAAPAGLPSPPVQLGDQLLFLEAWLNPERPARGASAELVTRWQVIGQLPADRDAVVFAQILDSEGHVVAQQDRLDVPSWSWQVGDQLVQLLYLALPAELPAGSYRLIAGVYTIPDRVDAVLAGHEPDPAMPRLPVLIGGSPAGDAIELPAVEVVADVR